MGTARSAPTDRVGRPESSQHRVVRNFWNAAPDWEAHSHSKLRREWMGAKERQSLKKVAKLQSDFPHSKQARVESVERRFLWRRTILQAAGRNGDKQGLHSGHGVCTGVFADGVEDVGNPAGLGAVREDFPIVLKGEGEI